MGVVRHGEGVAVEKIVDRNLWAADQRVIAAVAVAIHDVGVAEEAVAGRTRRPISVSLPPWAMVVHREGVAIEDVAADGVPDMEPASP